MTIVSTAGAALLEEFSGGQTGDVDMMIGVGLVKDTEAVFFEYLGDDEEPAALMRKNGRALTRMSNVSLGNIDIAEDIGEFNSTKLNLFLNTGGGRSLLVTSGLTTIWSQCVVTCLMGMLKQNVIDVPFHLDTWKGTSKMRPCFAAIRVGQAKISDNELYELLSEARADKDSAKVETLMRNAVAALQAAVGTEEVNVTVAPELAPAEAETDLF